MAWFDDLAGGFSVSAGAITLATGIYGLSVAAEKVAKPQALAEIGRILTKRAEPFPSAAASWILKLFRLTYGDRQFSDACWRRSVFAFFILTLAVVALGIPEGHVPFAAPRDLVRRSAGSFHATSMVVGAVAAYLSVWKTRVLLKTVAEMRATAALAAALVSDFLIADCWRRYWLMLFSCEALTSFPNHPASSK